MNQDHAGGLSKTTAQVDTLKPTAKALEIQFCVQKAAGMIRFAQDAMRRALDGLDHPDLAYTSQQLQKAIGKLAQAGDVLAFSLVPDEDTHEKEPAT